MAETWLQSYLRLTHAADPYGKRHYHRGFAIRRYKNDYGYIVIINFNGNFNPVFDTLDEAERWIDVWRAKGGDEADKEVPPKASHQHNCVY